MGHIGREIENLGDGSYLLFIPCSPRPVAYNLLELQACHGFLGGSNIGRDPAQSLVFLDY